MLKGKNLWIALGVGAVAYYLWMQNKKKQAAKVVAGPSTAAANFTGDLDVTQYQNANGDTTRKRVDTISGSSPFKYVVLKGKKPKQ
jgi:uncharacterized protein HemX